MKIETKNAPAALEIKDIAERIERTFAEFKSANDERLAALIKKTDVDILVEQKVDHINADLGALTKSFDDLQKKSNRWQLARGEDSAEVAEHKAAFNSYVRRGYDRDLRDLEAKALSTGSNADGGFAVPEQIDNAVLDRIKLISPLRDLASVIQVSTSDYKKLVNIRGTASGWVGETDSRPDTATPKLHEVPAVMGTLYANPAASSNSLEDIFFDVEAWLQAEISDEFAQKEGAAFISGDGTNKPKGFLAYTVNTSADGVRTFGDLQMVKTGVAGAFVATSSSTNPGDTFIDTVHAMKAPLRAGAAWLMNATTLASVRKFRDVEGNYIWRPGFLEGQPQTLLGYRVVEAADMPDVAANTFPVAFGNWARAYQIVDRRGIFLLRDPFTNKPNVSFYTTKRVGGMVVDSEAIKLLATRV
jgi:HK97 family phage major capsid protein